MAGTCRPAELQLPGPRGPGHQQRGRGAQPRSNRALPGRAGRREAAHHRGTAAAGFSASPTHRSYDSDGETARNPRGFSPGLAWQHFYQQINDLALI